MLSIRDPIHGFIRADPLEAALVNSRPLQRLRSIRQLGLTYLVFPGAEHSRFSHVLGAMQLAGRVYDAIAAKSDGLLPIGEDVLPRRLVRAAALLHDIGHAPFSHTAEELFEGGIDHEEMTRRLLALPEMGAIFEQHGRGVDAESLARLLAGGTDGTDRLLTQIISGELDVDKMDYLLRDSLYCGVRYGSFDLDRLIDTMLPLEDPETGDWGVGVDAGGVHALEALVMARYYMFTQVYFNVTGKVLELHMNRWLEEVDRRWPCDPEAFLLDDDVSMTSQMRLSDSLHARAVTDRDHFPLAFETEEHLDETERESFEAILPGLRETFGAERLLVSHSAKDPHRLGRARVLVRTFDGDLAPMEQASQFIRHLARIESYRIYAPEEIRREVAEVVKTAWPAIDPTD